MSGFTHNKSFKDQQGIVSIIVVTILTITLALIAIGFSKLANRELQQASDRELSNQAYYAAQSGLSDAIAYLSSPGATSFPGCAPPASASSYFAPTLTPAGQSGEAKYSCISVNNTPQVLTVSNLKPGQPQVVLVSASNLRNLYLSWQNNGYNSSPTGLGGTGTLPRDDTTLAKGATGLIRLGIYRVPAGDTSDTNVGLAQNSKVYYLYPNWVGGRPLAGSLPYGGSYSVASGPTPNNGSFIPGNCTTTPRIPVVSNTQAKTYYCNSEITGLDPTSTYYLYFISQYATLNVNIQGTDGGTPPGSVIFNKSQAVIDVTGQGADVIQRIRATVSLTPNFQVPAYSVQSMETLCKDFNDPLVGVSTYGTATALDSGVDQACVSPQGGGTVNPGGTAGH